jgi:hypothetical protein
MQMLSRAPAMLVAAIVLLAITALAATVPGASGVGPDPARDPVQVKIIGHGDLLDGGARLEVRVKVRCDPVGELQEALITASQDDSAIFGEGFFGRITCDGRPRTYPVRANSLDQPFHAGKAFVSAYVLLFDEESGEDFTGQDTRTIPVH